jgi:hypothetical protein
VARTQALRDAGGGGADDAEVRLALLRERRRQRDEDRVALAELVVVGRRAHAVVADEPAERLRRHVLDVALAAVQALDAVGVDVDEQDVVARLGEHLGQGHADVARTDDCDPAVHRPGSIESRASATRSEAWPSP